MAVTLSGGVVQAARLALGAVAPIPLRASGAEQYLVGKCLDESTAAEAAALAEAHKLDSVQRQLEGKSIRKTIWVKDKLLNLIAG